MKNKLLIAVMVIAILVGCKKETAQEQPKKDVATVELIAE